MALNPRTTRYEFFGPPGAALVMVGTTLVPYLLYFGCQGPDRCPPPLYTAGPWEGLVDRLQALTVADVFRADIFALYVAWFLYLVVLYYALPGSAVPGTVLRNGQRLPYRINGFRSLLVTCGVMFAVYQFYGGHRLFLFISDNYVYWLTSATLFSTLQAVFVYVRSFRRAPPNQEVLLALGGNSGNTVYDFFIGRELNPRIGSLDLKVFNELRPGILGWFVLNFAFLIKQAQTLDGGITDSMILIFLLQGVYIFDTLIFEASVLTTMDVTTDGFGWMLSFGDLVWVPFTFSLQARYLSFHPTVLGPVNSGIVLAVAVVGFLIFRLSNSQKNIFRTNPHDPRVKDLKYIETESGSKLLISGWWGLARHINYLGDWLFGLSWCLTTGFDTPIPYFYVMYFAVLLVHRERRDDHKCRTKYKKDWDRYCSIVRYRIIPGIY